MINNNNYKMGVESLLILANVMLGTLSTNYKRSQKVNKISIKWFGYPEGQLHMCPEGKDNIASLGCIGFKRCWQEFTATVVAGTRINRNIFESCV
jgi:hypothetical protein